MKFILTDYQVDAVDDLVKKLNKATREFAEDSEYTAVSLSAPTGAGKTVIAAGVIEGLIKGTDAYPANPDAAVLWITDNPSLNEQTRRKIMDAAEDSLGSGSLVTIDESFDQRVFDRNKVYFLNIQKLGKKAQWGKSRTDNRHYSVWETIANTIAERGANFYLVIDEAHRGTGSPDAARPTIVTQIISGRNGSSPAPVVLGISATLDIFNKAMEGSEPTRNARPHKVPVQKVRESGLLKENINIAHPDEKQSAVKTLTKSAAAQLRDITNLWADYATENNEPLVEPALVVQIPANTTDASLAEILTALEEEWEELKGTAIVHALDTHQALALPGNRVVKYMSPEAIQDNTHVKVVLFKEALTTGWDCPRAEVMLSLRKAKDFTYIAQLIGRMVRTPLARRITTDERLNEVELILPHYDAKTVEQVIERLKTDPDAPPVGTKLNAVDCFKNTTLDASIFTAMESLPTYVVPAKAYTSQVTRLNRLATLLVGDDINDKSLNTATSTLMGILDANKSRLEASGDLDKTIADITSIKVRNVKYSVKDASTKTTSDELVTDSGDVDTLFKDAKRKLRDGLAVSYWSHLIDQADNQSDQTSDDFKVIVAALSSDPQTVQAVEDAASKLIGQWLKKYQRNITDLPAAQAALYEPIKAQAKDPELSAITLPKAITVSTQENQQTLAKHLYARRSDKLFPVKFKSSWEEQVVDAELNAGAAAWYLNPVGGTRSIRVPYNDGAGDHPLYPDFVFFFKAEDGSIRSCLLDPHDYTRADTGPKWRGLCKYAEEHGDSYHRIEAIIKDGNDLLSLNLKSEENRKAFVKAGNDKADILTVFKKHGGNFSAADS